MKKKYIITFVQIICIFLLCILLLVCMYQKYIEKKNFIKIGGIGIAIINSGSMEPTLKIGELIMISEKKQYNIDDIILFQEQDALVTHRIETIEADMVTTRGDANNISDEAIPVENIQGKVIFHSFIAGCILNYAIRPIFLVISIYIIVDSIKQRKIKESKIKMQKRCQETIKREFKKRKEETQV